MKLQHPTYFGEFPSTWHRLCIGSPPWYSKPQIAHQAGVFDLHFRALLCLAQCSGVRHDAYHLHFCDEFHAKPNYQATQPTTVNTVIAVIDFCRWHLKQKVRSEIVVQQKRQRIKKKTVLPHHTKYSHGRRLRRVCYRIETKNNCLFSSTLFVFLFTSSSTPPPTPPCTIRRLASPELITHQQNKIT